MAQAIFHVQNLADASEAIAYAGAAEYLAKHHLTADPEALTSCLASWIKIKLPEALNDAREALDLGMNEAADMTFRASLYLAGIEAAKEASKPPIPSENLPQ